VSMALECTPVPAHLDTPVIVIISSFCRHRRCPRYHRCFNFIYLANNKDQNYTNKTIKETLMTKIITNNNKNNNITVL